MPSWVPVATNTEHFNLLQENSKITLHFYFYYLKLRKFSHLILDNILSSFPFLFHRGAVWVGI